ncbi:hypothetical protein [Moraxella lacunata]
MTAVFDKHQRQKDWQGRAWQARYHWGKNQTWQLARFVDLGFID